jgi:hypothetical protein
VDQKKHKNLIMKSKSLHPTNVYFKSTLFALFLLYTLSSKGQFIYDGSNARVLSCASTISSYPYTESFESGTGAWTQETTDDHNWTRNSGSTPTANTGPTAASAGSWYMFVESSAPYSPSQRAAFISPCFNLSAVSNPYISFNYHMYGATTGSLELQASTDGITWTALWSASGDKGNTWFTKVISLNAYSAGTVQLKMVGVTGSGATSDMAIDDIIVGAGVDCASGISAFPYTESFESGIGAWSQSSSDNYDWTRRSGTTPTSSTGPPGASAGTWYYYTEANGPSNGHQAFFMSPCFNLTNRRNATFSFDRNMYGSNMGTLRFEASSNGTNWTTLWTLTGNQGTAWATITPDISAYEGSNVQFRFVGIKGGGARSDMAIDNISLTATITNGAPTAVPDIASSEAAGTTIDVLDNDSDVNGHTLTLTGITAAPDNGGTATVNNNGTPGDPTDDFIDFTPSGFYAGTEVFSYRICDNGTPSLCAETQVSVTVDVNTLPTAVADAVNANTPAITIDVLANDSDPNGDNITLTTILVAPNHGGTATINNNGTPADPTDDYIDFEYSGLYEGFETFVYRICDDGDPSLCNTAVVTVNVNPNFAPVANNDNTATINQAIVIDVLANDTDSDGDDLTITSILAPPSNGGSVSIKDNGTPANPNDDYIAYEPSGVYFGAETFTYQICDDGTPSFCSSATVSVVVTQNFAPEATNDDATTTFYGGTINIDVLDNDIDPNPGQPLTISAITVAPNHGGSATINNNGTPGNPADDFIEFTPSGLYIGNETFTYQICDSGSPILCATAVVTVDITSCPDPSSPEVSPNFALNSFWKYDDSGADLGTDWRNASYNDDCWDWDEANLGFGDTHNTVITNHGGATYYFRKHFNVADVTAINYLRLGLVKDDGAAIYINGMEVFRTNLPTGTISFSTLAPTFMDGAAETAVNYIIVPASVLVNGDNVIAVEIHQQSLGSSDVNFDLSMSADMIDHSADILIAQNQHWNYNDNGIDLGTTWRTTGYRETQNEWQSGIAELGYGDADENTIVEYGPSSTSKYPTTYFRHYFSVYDFELVDTLLVKLRRDDGAVIYINGQEVVRSSMPTGTINYSTYANVTADGSNEDIFFEFKFLATMLVSGTNEIAVEIHQVNATSSDISFELELSLIAGDPNNYPVTYETLSGKVFFDIDVNRELSPDDQGQGALEVFSYFDKNNNGNIDKDTDPRLFSYLTDFDGSFTVNAYYAEVVSTKSDIASSNGDAAENGLLGAMDLNATKYKSLTTLDPGITIVDTLGSWKYYQAGDIGTTTWKDLGYSDAAWSTGNGDFGFGDPGFTTTLTSGRTTYYFRKAFTGGGTAGSLNSLRMIFKRDDGIVVYLNGAEVYRNNMPDGPIAYATLAESTIDGTLESEYIEVLVPNLTFNILENVLAVEVHQVSAGSSDVAFDMRATAENNLNAQIGYRFDNIDVPQGARIIDAFLRVTSATTSTKVATIHIEAEDTDDAAVFSSTPYDITDRTKTTASLDYLEEHKFFNGREIRIDGLKPLVQEIVNRPGWVDGNAMAFFLSGFETEFYTFNGSYAPELTISYLDSSSNVVQYLIGIAPEDLPEELIYMTDPSPAAAIGSNLRAINDLNIGYLGTTSMCAAVSDDEFDALHVINRFSGKNKMIGPLGGAREVESIAFSANADSLFAVDGDEFGLINTSTGAFTGYGNVIGTANGAIGSTVLNDVDGLAWDLGRGLLWATERRGAPDYDLIFIINPNTGEFIPGGFGGFDYVVATGGGVLYDLDDIAVNPVTGNLFAMNNDNGGLTNLIEIDITSGLPNIINPTGLNDMEGQGFHNDGTFYSTSGRDGEPRNAFYEVDTSNSVLTLVGYFEDAGDFEGCDCKSAPFANIIEGVVFEDIAGDGELSPGDNIDPGVTVYLFEDVDNDGQLSVGDILIDSFITDAFGQFFFYVNPGANYLVTFNFLDLPSDVILTTPMNREATFFAMGNFNLGNNFGYTRDLLLPVELLTFSGETVVAENHLFWKTATETNSSHFNILRSKDAIHFEYIGNTNASGNSNRETNYTFIDEEPTTGLNYYQLEQVDLDGAIDYSKIIVLTNEVEKFSKLNLNVWPNPTKENIQLSGLNTLIGKVIGINIVDIAGAVRISKSIEITNDNVRIDLDELGSGYYLIHVDWDETSETFSFIKQ